jgi:hypothetical protein
LVISVIKSDVTPIFAKKTGISTAIINYHKRFVISYCSAKIRNLSLYSKNSIEVKAYHGIRYDLKNRVSVFKAYNGVLVQNIGENDIITS